MNYRAMEWAFKQPLDDHAAKFLLVTIAGHAGRDNTCFPSYARLSEMTGMSVRTIARKAVDLQKSGLVSMQVRKRKNGSYTSKVYTLMVDSPSDKLTTPSSQDDMTIRDNTPIEENINSSSSGDANLAGGGFNWEAMGAAALGLKGKDYE